MDALNVQERLARTCGGGRGHGAGFRDHDAESSLEQKQQHGWHTMLRLVGAVFAAVLAIELAFLVRARCLGCILFSRRAQRHDCVQRREYVLRQYRRPCRSLL